MGVEPMIRKSTSPPPARMAWAAAAFTSYSGTPGRAASAIARVAAAQRSPARRTRSSSAGLFVTRNSWKKSPTGSTRACGRASVSVRCWLTGM